MQNTEQKVKEIIIRILCVHEYEVTPEAQLKGNLGADSLDIVELVMEFEKEFDISIPDEFVEDVETVQQAIDVIDKILAKKK